MRKKLQMPKAIESWEQLDSVLETIGAKTRSLEKIEHTMQERIDKAKTDAAMAAQPLKDEVKELEAALMIFLEDRKNEFETKKTRELNFGSVGYRKSTKVVLPRGESKMQELINKLKALGMQDCIVAKQEKVDKEALKAYSEEDIKEAGAWLDVQDKPWYEVKREEVK